MVALILDPGLQEDLIADRQARGIDGFDEVWDGVYMMSPAANDEHQDLATGIATVLRIAVQWSGLGDVRQGVNVSDREDDWRENFRVPDTAVFLKDTRAVNRDSHWFGGPDFGVEIVSEYDRTREKFDFYAKVGTRELLIVDRYPWSLELYRLCDGALHLVGSSTADRSDRLTGELVPLSWRLVPGEQRPQIEILHADGRQHWLV